MGAAAAPCSAAGAGYGIATPPSIEDWGAPLGEPGALVAARRLTAAADSALIASMEPEAAPAQPAPPVVEQQPVAAPAPRSPSATLARSHGNAAIGRMAGAAGAPISPGVARALAPHTGNAVLARMLQGQRAIARDNGAPAPPAPAGGQQAAAPAGAPPRLGLPGAFPISLPAGPGQIASTNTNRVIKAASKSISIPIPIPRPLVAEVGGVISGAARYYGGISLRWDRPAAPVTDPMSVTDTVKVENGKLGATGAVAGGVFGKIGVDAKLAKAMATAQGTLKAEGTGDFNASGSVTRNGVNGQWTGGIQWSLTATGTLTAAATGYFEWRVLWFEGREQIFKLESFPLGTITARLGGEMKPDGSITCPTRDFDITLGSAPKPAESQRRTAPAGGQPAQVAPKRLAADAPPPDEPPPGANRLARSPDAPGGAPAPADQGAPAAAPGAPGAPAPAPAGPAAAPGQQQPRPPAEVAGGAEEANRIPGGMDAGASSFVPAEEPEAVEP